MQRVGKKAFTFEHFFAHLVEYRKKIIFQYFPNISTNWRIYDFCFSKFANFTIFRAPQKSADF